MDETIILPNATLAAISWVQSVLLGNIAALIATIAIAGVGLMMLTGRVELKRGTITVFACFVIFGAPVIVAGLREALAANSTAALAAPRVAEAPIPVPPPVKPATYDPYAGAAVPQNR